VTSGTEERGVAVDMVRITLTSNEKVFLIMGTVKMLSELFETENEVLLSYLLGKLMRFELLQ
jgi:hypothetical protein